MTGIVGRAREEGIEQGMQQGLSRGEVEGERALLIRQLKRRFGELPADAEQRLQKATTDELERWGENVLEAQTLDEVFTQH